MSHDDVLFGYRLRLFTLAEEIGVSPACRAMGVHHSTYYRLKRKVDRWGLEALRIRERRRPRMPNQIGPHLEQRVIAFCLGHPGFGPRRVSSELARAKWGGLRISEHGVWRVLCRYGLNTRSKRLALIARHATPTSASPSGRRPSATSTPQSRARRSSSTASTSAACRARRARSGSTRPPTSPRASPGPSCTPPRQPALALDRELVHRVARELKAAGWRLQRGHHRQRLGVPRQRVRGAVEQPAPASGGSRPAARLQRLRRAPPADDPRGVLASGLRALAGPEDHGARARPRRVPRLLQLRPRPHRPPDQRSGARRYRLRRPQDEDREMSTKLSLRLGVRTG